MREMSKKTLEKLINLTDEESDQWVKITRDFASISCTHMHTHVNIYIYIYIYIYSFA